MIHNLPSCAQMPLTSLISSWHGFISQTNSIKEILFISKLQISILVDPYLNNGGLSHSRCSQENHFDQIISVRAVGLSGTGSGRGGVGIIILVPLPRLFIGRCDLPIRSMGRIIPSCPRTWASASTSRTKIWKKMYLRLLRWWRLRTSI